MYKVVYAGINPEDSDVIREILPADEFEFHVRPERINGDEEKLIAVCRDADAVIADYEYMSRRALMSMPRLKLVQFMSVGFDYIDGPAAKELGIAVANCPTYCTNEVADHTVALMLSINRRIVQYRSAIQDQGLWDATREQNMYGMRELTVGLAGFGAIPRQVARRVQAFGARVIAYDPYVDGEAMASVQVEKVDFNELLARSDYLSCHVPALPSTIGLFNKEAFAKCKDGVCFFNTSRGAIPVEEDLIEALRSGKVAFAGLDVLASENVDPRTHPLCHMDNVLVTPHAAFYSASSRRNSRIEAANGILHFLRGEYDLCPIRNGVRQARRP